MNMKTLLAIILATLITSHASAKPAVFCSLYHSRPVIAVATAHSQNDKNRHCTVSCMLALKCNDNEVMLVGLLKEFKDVFGPGDADAEDIEADALGVSLASRGSAKTNKQCLAQCDLYYR